MRNMAPLNPFKSPAAPARPRTSRQSIRGRISGPIPMPESLVDYQFNQIEPGPDIKPVSAPRDHGVSVGASSPPMGDEDIEETDMQQDPKESPEETGNFLDDPDASDDEAVYIPPVVVPETPTTPTATVVGSPSAAQSRPSPSSAGRGSGPARTHRRLNPSSTTRYSTLSATSGSSGKVRDMAPQRKKSTLRGTLSKLFGRRKKGSQASIDPGRMSTVAPNLHRSDPSALNGQRQGNSKRTASLPATEFSGAFRSHAVGVQGLSTIEDARNSLQAESFTSRKRAATTTSGLFANPRRGDAGGWTGLSPRPASTHGRSVSRLTVTGSEDPEQIGRAITSDVNAGKDLAHRRRSRSLSGLQELADQQPEAHSRNQEIRYWRESYDQPVMSPISSTAEDMDDDRDDFHEMEDPGVLSRPAREAAAAELPPQTPPQPFNFGSLATMSEMAGMKITQVANIDIRIGNLENRVHTTERLIDQLCHTVPGFKGPFAEVTPARPASGGTQISVPSTFVSSTGLRMVPISHQVVSNDQSEFPGRFSSSRQSGGTEATSHRSFGDGQTFISSLHPPSSSATQAQSSVTTAEPDPKISDRRISNSTVRGVASLPTLGRDAHEASSEEPFLPAGHAYSTLQAQLEAERAARVALEAQVKKLSNRVNTLSTTMFAMVRDPKKSKSHERLTQSSSASPLSSLSTTASTPAVPPLPQSMARPATMGQKPRSAFGEYDEERSPKRMAELTSETEETSSDAFQTPREETSPSYGTFSDDGGTDEDDEDAGRRKARTLSLSQMTMGKGQRIQI